MRLPLTITALLTACSVAGPALAQSSPVRMKAGMHTSSGSCVSCDLSQKSMTRIRLLDSNFSNSNFYRSNLSGGRFDGTNLSGAIFSKAYLIRAEGERVDLSSAVLRDATLTQASLKVSLFTGADMRRADLTSGIFAGSTFTKADMSSAIAREADFKGADMRGARLPMANLTGADLAGANLTGVHAVDLTLEGAKLDETNLSGADLRGAKGLTQGQLDTACGDADTRLPARLSVSYCDDGFAAAPQMLAERAAVVDTHDHDRAVARLDSAIGDIEVLMEGDELDSSARRKLQRVHSKLVGSRRELR